VLAEFIVASAMNVSLFKPREEWNAYDVETEGGIKIEVKASAYLQTWHQNDYSQIRFGIKPSLYWDSKTNHYESFRVRQSDVYVFCLFHHKDKSTANPLNLNQWTFYVLATKTLNQTCKERKNLSISVLKKMTTEIPYGQLREKILAEAEL
jgi:hypothetical protein